MVSVQQITALIDFLEAKPELALGRLNRTKEGRSLCKRQWMECANILNSISADCIHKSGDGWRLYYNEYKCKLIKKIKIEKREIHATGGGLPKRLALTPLQEQLYMILGHDIGDPLPGVRHNPLSQNSAPDELFNYDNNILFCEDVNTSSVQDVEEFVVVQPQPLEVQDDMVEASTSAAAPEQRPKRQHRKKTRRYQPYDQEASSNLTECQKRLEAMEKRTADAMMAHAEATHRLAAAIETLAANIGSTKIIIKKTEETSNVLRLSTDSDSRQ